MYNFRLLNGRCCAASLVLGGGQMLNLHRLRRAVSEASEALRRVSEIIEEDRECCEGEHSQHEECCKSHHHHHRCGCGCEHHEGEEKKEEHGREGCCEEEGHEHCCHHHRRCCDEEDHEPPYPPFPPYPPYPAVVITSGCGCVCQHSAQTPGVTVAGYPATYAGQTAGTQATEQSAASQATAPAVNMSLNTFPDLSNITNVEALLSLGESVAAQVRELIP